ncbi:hypothetical protein L3N51_02154 [Metallosphaera sp. J1]|uniref:hypothetical protein n=1 Tax=Metallosphaera TaxID=41980 RepID=UPI001EDFCEAF|nr:hypothetical protein [Metallosphaera javensis (ex Hofmann et al. 2022)]MCG3109858.1 hypothetical protein [Metallosphaera javensis (ex Hofmann et al. 2022)]BCS92114.1 MAG: nucleotidyltransferase [Metallosphaera javensis (ex Sakai et al. 2022)]
MGRNYYLDKDAVIDREGNIGFVITNQNPPGYVYGYTKYIYTGRGLWKGYERVLRYYGVHNLINSPQVFSMEPCHGVEFPIIPLSRVRRHLYPEEGFRKILSNEKKMELHAMFSLLDKIPNIRLGITGSYLVGIEHANSDVDMVIYGCKDAYDFLSSFPGGSPDVEWIREASRNYSLDVEEAKSLYDVRTRGVYRGMRYSFLFVDDKPHPYCREVCSPLREVIIEGEMEGDCRSLFYPAVAGLYSHDYYEVISWEGIYSMAMFKGGLMKVKGLELECSGKRVILIGDRRVKGNIRVLQ